MRRAGLAWLAGLTGLATLATFAAACSDGTTPDCSDAQCLPVLVEAGPIDAGDASDDTTTPASDAADGG